MDSVLPRKVHVLINETTDEIRELCEHPKFSLLTTRQKDREIGVKLSYMLGRYDFLKTEMN